MPRRVKKTRRRGRVCGGAFLGRGVSGCVFKPALRCKGELTRREGKLGKLMRQNYAEEEFQKRTLVEPFNADQTFFVYPEDLCEPELPFNASNEVEKCSVSNFQGLDDRNKRILIVADGGQSLTNLQFVRPGNMYQLFESLVNIFDGLILLHSVGVVHMDVKPDNIVTQFKDNRFKTRLIDFGLSFKIDTLPALVKMNDTPYYDYLIFMANYVFWGPELRLIKPDYTNELYDRNIAEQKRLLEQQYPGQNISSNIIAKLDEFNIDNDYKTYYKSLVKLDLLPKTYFVDDKFILTHRWALDISDKLYNLSDIDRWTLVFKKTDVFGLGQSIVYMYTKCVEMVRVGYPMLANELLESVEKYIGPLYFQMVDPNPFTRITMEYARTMYVKYVLPELARILRVPPDEIKI